MKYSIRKMIPSDAKSVAKISINGWRLAYKGIFPDKFLNELDLEKRELNWKAGIQNNDPDIIRIVLENQNEILSFACGRENRDTDLVPQADCELWAMYTEPSFTRQGLGNYILDSFKEEMRALGKKRMLIWCLENNIIGRSFYEKNNGILITQAKDFFIEGHSFKEVGYIFPL